MSIPSVVVAETVRGSAKHAPVNRVIKAVGEIEGATENTFRIAGALLGAARSDSTVDAVVVASVIERVVVSSSPAIPTISRRSRAAIPTSSSARCSDI